MSGKKRKGLSADDKRSVILSIYHEKKDPLNLKEIENFASKLGVVQQTVKEHNQSLVDDGLVLSDKIGSSNFYWSFPSKEYQDRLRNKESLVQSINSLNANIESGEMKFAKALESRNGTDRKVKVSN